MCGEDQARIAATVINTNPVSPPPPCDLQQLIPTFSTASPQWTPRSARCISLSTKRRAEASHHRDHHDETPAADEILQDDASSQDSAIELQVLPASTSVGPSATPSIITATPPPVQSQGLVLQVGDSVILGLATETTPNQCGDEDAAGSSPQDSRHTQSTRVQVLLAHDAIPSSARHAEQGSVRTRPTQAESSALPTKTAIDARLRADTPFQKT